MSRCGVILKSGSRTGRKCGRVNCNYHKDDLMDLTLSTDSIAENSSVTSADSICENSAATSTSPSTDSILDSLLQPIVSAMSTAQFAPLQYLSYRDTSSNCEEGSIIKLMKSLGDAQDPFDFAYEMEPIVESTQSVFDLSQPAFASTQPAFEPSQPAFEPSQPAFEPSQPAFEPSQPAFEPSQPVFELSQPAFEPSQASHQQVVTLSKDVINVEEEMPEEVAEKEDTVVDNDFVEVSEADCFDGTDVLVIDTETIGLPPHKTIPWVDKEWERCRAIQIAWCKFTASGEEVTRRNFIIRPNGFEVKLTNIHGITEEMAMRNGVPIEEVLKTLNHDLKTVETIVAHNIDFDAQVIGYEFYRACVQTRWESIHKDCTMKMAKASGISEGPIRLPVLFERCFQETVDLSTLHNASVDVELCGRIYFYLKECMAQKLYFPVDYKDKDVFKFFGGIWDPEKKSWYTYKCHRFLPYLKKWFK